MRTFVLLLAAAGTLAAAGPSYFGKWKFNPGKSDFGESTVTFAQTATGAMQLTADGQSFTFQADGKDYPTPYGETAAWKQIDASTWETIHKLNGKTLATDTVKLSADGQMLTIESKGTKPAGGAFENTTAFQRVSGTAGLAGQWKTRNVKSSSPETLELAASGENGLLFQSPDIRMTSAAKFDGKDYPVTGPTLAAGWTLALRKAGPLAFDMTVKQNGKPLYEMTFRVSPDGKTLTETGCPTGVKENYTAVYDRE